MGKRMESTTGDGRSGWTDLGIDVQLGLRLGQGDLDEGWQRRCIFLGQIGLGLSSLGYGDLCPYTIAGLSLYS
jgi:hypothetical protein